MSLLLAFADYKQTEYLAAYGLVAAFLVLGMLVVCVPRPRRAEDLDPEALAKLKRQRAKEKSIAKMKKQTAKKQKLKAKKRKKITKAKKK